MKPPDIVPSTPVQIEAGDAILEGLCSDWEHSDAELEEEKFEKVRKKISGGKMNRDSSPIMNYVKHSVSIGPLKRRGRRKKVS